MNGISAEEKILRNLKDAGCGDDVIENFLGLWKAGRTKEQMKLLSIHRAALLDRVHAGQKMIDCLDYLVYELKKENKI